MPQSQRGCLGFLFGSRGPDRAAGGLPQMQLNKFFISDAERSFYHVLRQAVGGRAVILMQVAINRLVWMPGNNRSSPGRASWENKLRGRSLDFLLCDPRTLRPLVGIELDDATHAQPRRQTRDDEVEQAMAAAGLPLLHLLAEPRGYSTRELEEALAPYLAPAPPAARSPRG